MKPRSIDWDKWDALLGTMPDSALADRIGCNVLAVKRRRKKKNVPSYREQLERYATQIRKRRKSG